MLFFSCVLSKVENVGKNSLWCIVLNMELPRACSFVIWPFLLYIFLLYAHCLGRVSAFFFFFFFFFLLDHRKPSGQNIFLLSLYLSFTLWFLLPVSSFTTLCGEESSWWSLEALFTLVWFLALQTRWRKRSKEKNYFFFAVPQMVRPKAFIRLTMLSVYFVFYIFFFIFDFIPDPLVNNARLPFDHIHSTSGHHGRYLFIRPN